jgi:ADP-ribose pyrophosphatase
MGIFIPRRRSSEIVGRFGFLDVERHDVETAEHGSYQAYTLRLMNWASVVAITEEGQLVLVRQHRYGIDAVTIEVAGGLIDPGEEPAEAAARELLEETGYAGGPLEPLGVVHPNPAIQGNTYHMFLTRDARKVAEIAGDPHESVEAVVMARGDVLRGLEDGRISHALSALALERALARAR